MKKTSRAHLIHLLEPPIDAIEAPLISYIVDKNNTLGAARIRSDDRAEASLAGCVPQLELYALPLQQDGGRFVCYRFEDVRGAVY